ncbi:hypothetical protein M409DRAFT_63252 [Zasmidium cellare ATCC 36951]|uniref:Uncharacterized protein n=1 Tax=Zasmidium cellare ATCC 36951 TaxID=1080233 RepID=A0A6A6CZI2_ZASCE|nr:uncharacterized protein M409DRAFT_63252 [Zasmidium cellare ATCC 36951]KAF2171610.1 hypothetical protein M409DRAFT_63252 [Zasmidium cellare ATCC 36951]
MPSTPVYIAATAVVVIGIFAGYIAVFGIPKEYKRAMEEKALETMGENKASYLTKDALNKVPDSDQEDVKDLKQTGSNAAGGALQNPLGKLAGNTADDATKDFTGR